MKEKINTLIKEAMVGKNSVALGILRLLKGEIERVEQDPKLGKIEVPEEKIYKIINTLIETATEDEATVLNSLLPEQLTEEKLRYVIDTIISEHNLAGGGKSGMGVIMKELNANYSGQYDKSFVAPYANQFLG